MTAREEGFLLLTSCLGDPQRKPLTGPQLRELTAKARAMERPAWERELTWQDLAKMGCSRTLAERVVRLLDQKEQLDWYLQEGKQAKCYPLTRISEGYPHYLHMRLGMEAPGVLWCKGDTSLLGKPAVALVGSRELKNANLQFAKQLGGEAARQGYVLVSGNAKGADRAAQEACLEAGGQVICVVADSLREHSEQARILYVAEEDYDAPFSAFRALHRNRIIHALGQKVFVAQSGLGSGGTWNGTAYNLKKGLSPVFCFDDGSQAMKELCQMGAAAVTCRQLEQLDLLTASDLSFIDP